MSALSSYRQPVDTTADFIEDLLASESARWRPVTLDELRQEAWATVLEHGCDVEAVRRAWRRMTRGDRLPKTSWVIAHRGEGEDQADVEGWHLDWMPTPEPPHRPDVPTELVDPPALQLVEAVMLDGADFEAARIALGYSRMAARRVMRAAGVTVTGRRLDRDFDVEGLLAYQGRTRPRHRLTFADIAREMGRTVSGAEQLLARWERTGVIEVPRDASNRRQWDWVTVTAMLVLDRAHEAAWASARAARRQVGQNWWAIGPRALPAAWGDLAAAIVNPAAKQVRFEPGRDRWTVGTGGTSPLTVSLISPRTRARLLCSDDVASLHCTCGCGRALRADNRSGLATPCARQLRRRLAS